MGGFFINIFIKSKVKKMDFCNPDGMRDLYQEIYLSEDVSIVERWDEPGERDSAQVRSDNAYFAKKLKAKKDAQQRMKEKGTIPKKGGKEMFESVVEYLFVEGYADTIESAELMAESISEDWMNRILEAKKEPDFEKMKKQEYRHTKKATSQSGGSRGTSKNRAFKMDTIRRSLERGEDPRADTFGGKRASNPEDHRAAYSKNPLNNPPRRVKKPGV